VRFEVGVGDAVPKLVAMAVLRPAYQIGRPVRVVVREWRMDQMLSELARERIDLVLSEAAAPSSAPGHPVSQMIGNSRVGIFGASELVENYRAGFPRSLDGAPLLLPVEGLPLRTSIDAWLNVRGIVPRIVGETEDRAMLHHLAMEGYGMVPIPEILATDIQRQFRVEAIGWLQGVREHYFAVWVARKQTHPAIQAIREQTKKGLLVADAGARALESRDGDVNSDAAGLDDGAG
jgi:LysR family transcriptional activator of nhaA